MFVLVIDRGSVTGVKKAVAVFAVTIQFNLHWQI